MSITQFNISIGDGDQLRVEPAGQLTDGIRDYIKANRDDLFAGGDAVMIVPTQDDMPSSLEELILWLQDHQLAVLKDDRDFIKEILPMASDERDRVIAEYAQVWVQAMKGEPAIKRQNVGRLAANQFLMEFDQERSQTPGRQWYSS